MKTAPDVVGALAASDHPSRLAAMGLAARSTVHELNNQMVAILGLAELLLDALPADDTLRVEVEEIRAAGDKVVAKTRELALMTRLLVPINHA